jgi:cell division protein FtsL
MTRLNLVLLLAVLASAMVVVRTQYESRRVFVALERATAEARLIELENERLEVVRRGYSTPSRVEKMAKDKLGMRSANPAITQYVSNKDTAKPDTKVAQP